MNIKYWPVLLVLFGIGQASAQPGPTPSPWNYGPSLSLSYDNGGVTLGMPTGGSQGPGTINVGGGFYVNGSPVTTIGSQSANLIYASPNGSAGLPVFRQIANGDFPANIAITGTLGVTGLASLHAVSATTFTASTSLTSNNIISTEFPGLSASVESSGLAGYDGPTGGVNRFLYNAPSVLSGNAAVATLRVDRVPTGTGGSNSLVPTALLVRDSPPANDAFFEWTVNAQNYNSSLASTGSQNVGVAGSIFKIGAATQVGASWGGFFQAIDQTGVASPIGGTIGIEADSGTFGLNGGADPNKQRVIAQLDCTGLSGTHCSRGIFIIPQTTGVVIDSAITVASDPTGTVAFSVSGAGAVVAAGLIDGSAGGIKTPVAANGTVATALGSLGPVGSHTTVQEWIQVVGTGGAARYVPAF